VPITLDHNRIIIPLTVSLPGGKVRRVKAWIDNGTPVMSITRHLVDEIGSKPKINIGEISFSLDPSLEIENEATVARGVDAEISLPSTFLKNYDIIIDYPGRKFTIGSLGSVHFEGIAVKGFFNPKNSLIQLPAEVDAKQFNLALDIGTPVSFVSKDLIVNWKKTHPSWPTAKGAVGIANLWGLDDEPDWQLIRLQRMQYGGIEFPGPVAVTFPQGRMDYFEKRAGIATAGLFGAASMLNYRIGIDYLHKTVYFKQISKPVKVKMNLVGLTLRPEASKDYTVLGVSSYNGQLSVTDVSKGDTLKKINNTEVFGLTMGEIWFLLQGNPGAKYKLTIIRKDKKIIVNAKAYDFLK
jgi:hypothetical protein